MNIGWGHLKRHMKTHGYMVNTGMIKNDKEAIENEMLNGQQDFKRMLKFVEIVNNYMKKN